MKNRENKILELLTQNEKMEVDLLSELLGVSQVTIRKDLDILEEKGIVKREHGCALLCNTDDISGRIAYHYEEKRRIAEKAAELVSSGDTIMIENGSCCALLAEVLVFWYYKKMSTRQFGGVTGDLAGYFLEISELAMLTGMMLTGGYLWN